MVEPDPQAPAKPWTRVSALREQAARYALPAAILLAIAYFASVIHAHYPIQRWLFWRYAGYWLCCILWSASCISAGHLALKRLLGRALPLVEHLATSFAVGAFVFFLGMCAGGFLQLYHPVFFIALPLLMLGAGILPLWRHARRAARHLRYRARRAPPAPPWTYAALVFGLLGIGMVYFAILTPHNVQYDARWKHLALAEDYAVYGGIRRFPEGWTVETYPHLATILYTWAFLVPGGALFDKVELAAHMEFTGFLWTLVAISGAARLLVPHALGPHGVRLAWISRFLFPGVFLYDSSLSVGGDHISAIFAVPIFTSLARAYRDLSPRFLVLCSMMIAGGGLVKYTGMLLLAPFPILAVGVRMVMLGVQSFRGKVAPAARRNWYLGPLAAVAAGLFFTAPHWVKNWVYYGDPLYPTLYKYLSPRPWTVDSANLFVWGYTEAQFWRPSHDLAGVWQTLKALFTYSFIPNDWPRFHGKVPVFGSLFTLLLLCLPFLRRTKRIWGIVAYVHVSLFVWYWTHHQDRYLQAIVPLMAAATAAVIALLWRSHAVTKVALSGLIGLQIIWGGDVYFISTHAMTRSPVKTVVDLLSSGYRKEYDARLAIYAPFTQIAAMLPKGSRVLLHDNQMHLGIGATSVSDFGGWQYGISYGRMGTPREVHDMLRGMGVTHLLWDTQDSKGWDSIAGDITFFSFALRHGMEKKSVGGMTFAKMSPPPEPGEAFPDAVAFLGCNTTYRSGLYTRADMTMAAFGPKGRTYPEPRRPGPPKGESAEALAKDADVVVLEVKCQSALPPSVSRDFTLAAKRAVFRTKRAVEIWIRASSLTRPGAGAIEPPASTEARRGQDPAAGRDG